MKPSPRQLEFLDWEFGVFFHFGIRTFYEGHEDWDGKEMPLSGFSPSQLDCDDWIRAASQAGARYAILVCKHHDGFANWPSRYTDYSVANTPWKDGKGDVVKEFTEACRRYGLHIGLYYSPAQFGFERMSSQDYDDYFINQITELLSQYGKIDYLWFDGCGSGSHEYDKARIIGIIRKLQPDILLFNMWDPDTRWIGNEAGLAHNPNFNDVDAVPFSMMDLDKNTGGLQKTLFLPAECDCRMRLQNWFYSDKDEHTVKSLDELMGLYYYSVGRGANLLINIGPDRRGLLPDADKERLLAFGQEIKRRFSQPLPVHAAQGENSVVLTLDTPGLVNHVILEEKLVNGQGISSFQILVNPFGCSEPIAVYDGKSVGHKAICPFPSVYTEQITIRYEGGALQSTPQAFYVAANDKAVEQ